eukprot:SAG31_NODE_109_length_24587_cov_111.480848_10_plen_108_part_00
MKARMSACWSAGAGAAGSASAPSPSASSASGCAKAAGLMLNAPEVEPAGCSTSQIGLANFTFSSSSISTARARRPWAPPAWCPARVLGLGDAEGWVGVWLALARGGL